MTMHASKGLEFDTVFIIQANEGRIPYKRAMKEHGVEEERRLFYVGMTRAREELILTTAPEPSPFLEDLPGAVRRESSSRRWKKTMEQLSLF